MLFKVEMVVKLPLDMPKALADEIKRAKKHIRKPCRRAENGDIFGA